MKDIISNENFENGSVNISNDVVSIVASLAAKEVAGVVKISGGLTSEISEMFGMKNLAKGVEVNTANNDIDIDISVGIEYGFNLRSVGLEIQKNVKEAVETMTGLEVKKINVNIQEVIFSPKKEEI